MQRHAGDRRAELTAEIADDGDRGIPFTAARSALLILCEAVLTNATPISRVMPRLPCCSTGQPAETFVGAGRSASAGLRADSSKMVPLLLTRTPNFTRVVDV